MDLNRVTLIGRLTQDPEVKTTPSGQTVASFTVATSFSWKDTQGQKQERSEFHNIIAWRKLGEICGQYLQKGKQIYLEGRLQTRSWDGKDGVKRYKTEVIADNMIMLGSKGDFQSKPTTAPRPETPSTPATEVPTVNVGGSDDEIRIEDIPF